MMVLGMLILVEARKLNYISYFNLLTTKYKLDYNRLYKYEEN